MLQLERFAAAEKQLDALVKQYINVPGITGVALTEAPDSALINPGGPQFVVFYDDRKEADLRRADGTLPTSIDTEFDKVAVELLKVSFEATQAHTTDETPMRPGASVGGTRVSSGTLGAQLSSPGSGNHFITCGHVVFGQNPTDTAVYQASREDTRNGGRPDRKVGEVINTAFATNTNDSALVKLDPGFTLDANPHDSSAPSASTPAVGMQCAANSTKAFFVDIKKALADCGGAMPHTTQVNAFDKGRKVFASGRTSGEIVCRIDGRATITADGIPFPITGFWADKIKGAVGGDSGAVTVIQRGQITVVTTDDAAVTVTGTDSDDPAEYVPGVIPELDRLLTGDGSGITAGGTAVPQATGSGLLSRIAARIRQLGELEVVVTTQGFENPCREQELRRRPRPTGVREIILRPSREVELPESIPEDSEEIEGTGTCCTFGTSPFVTISGDDSQNLEFNLSVTGTAAIRVRYSVKQTVMSARFLRYGLCYRNICDKETLRGTVVLSRTTNFEIAGSLGEVELPVIGRIRAGEGSFKKDDTRTLRKKFIIPCGTG